MKRFTSNPLRKLSAQRRALASRPDKSATEAGRSEVRDLVTKQTGVAGNRVWLDDNVYFLPQKKTIESLLWWDGTNAYPYGGEGRDCDNFAKILQGRALEACMLNDCARGIAFGIVSGQFVMKGKLSEEHQMNLCVTADRKVWLIEPQSDAWFRPHPDNQYSLVHL